jgi:hypothetical protein
MATNSTCLHSIGPVPAQESTQGVLSSFAAACTRMAPLLWLIYLQVLDLLATLVFLAHGVEEANPMIRLIGNWSGSYLLAVTMAKSVGVLLGVICWRMGKLRIITLANAGYAALIVWNLTALLAAALGQ